MLIGFIGYYIITVKPKITIRNSKGKVISYVEGNSILDNIKKRFKGENSK